MAFSHNQDPNEALEDRLDGFHGREDFRQRSSSAGLELLHRPQCCFMRFEAWSGDAVFDHAAKVVELMPIDNGVDFV